MAHTNIQDRTTEFKSILHAAQRNRTQNAKLAATRQSLLSPSEKQAANGNGVTPAGQRSEFARQATEISRGVSGAMAKLQRLAELAKRKTLFDDRPVEINELTYIIKQDIAGLDNRIKQLQQLTNPSQALKKNDPKYEEVEHSKNVVFLLKGKLGDLTTGFKDTLELRTKNIQASRNRTDAFISSVQQNTGAATGFQSTAISRTDSPLYQPPQQSSLLLNGRRSPFPSTSNNPANDILSLDPGASSALVPSSGPATQSQLLMMEEGGSNTYIQQRGQAIETIEQTISELGGIFAQLAQMVSEQGEQIQRIDADTEDVLENVEGAQRELLKYWSRVQGNRWLVAKMFLSMMVIFMLWVLVAG